MGDATETTETLSYAESRKGNSILCTRWVMDPFGGVSKE